jgi:hypothetical protein
MALSLFMESPMTLPRRTDVRGVAVPSRLPVNLTRRLFLSQDINVSGTFFVNDHRALHHDKWICGREQYPDRHHARRCRSYDVRHDFYLNIQLHRPCLQCQRLDSLSHVKS